MFALYELGLLGAAVMLAFGVHALACRRDRQTAKTALYRAAEATAKARGGVK